MEEMLLEASGASFELVDVTDRLSTGLERLAKNSVDVVLLDLLLPDSQGLETFDRMHSQAPQVPIIVLSGLDDESLALEAVRKGAQDYLVKGEVDSRLLGRSIRYAIERHRTEKMLKRRAAELALLNDIGGRIVSVLDWERLLERAARMMQETFGYYNIAILTLNERGGDELTVRASVGALSDILLEDSQVELGQGMVGWAALHGETLLVNDVRQDSRYFNPRPARIETLSELSVPIIIGGEVTGVIDVQHPELDAFDENDKMVMETLADQIAVAMENARLYRSARQVDRLQVLSDLDEALASTLDPDEVAETTLEHVAAALDTSMGVLFHLSPHSGSPVRAFVLGRGWVDMSLEEDEEERLEDLLLRWEEKRKPIDLTSEDLVNLCPRGHRKLADRWHSPGLITPIRDEDDVVALLAVGGRSSQRPFTEEDRVLVQTAMNRVGDAMQNAWLFQASQMKSERLARLNAISSAAVSSLDLDTILCRVLDMTCEALGAAEGSILLRSGRSKSLRFAVTTSKDTTRLVGRSLEPGQGLADWTFRNRQAIYVNDVSKDSRWYSGIDEETGFETHSLLCAPLEHQDRVTGVIEVVNKHTGDFNDEDLNLLEAVASIAATAIENARLYADTQARAEELALLNEIGLALTSTLDYDEVVREAASHVRRLFQADGMFLLQTDLEMDDFCFVQTASGGETLYESPPCMSADSGLVEWLVKRQQPLLLEDGRSDPRFPQKADQYLEVDARSVMASPMLTPEGVRGLIAVLSEEEAAYDRDDLHILQTLGSTLTVALENARLYNEQKRLLREREETQAQLIHAEKMSALGRLAASIAHEINNPLQAVQGCLTLVDEEIQSEKREEKLERYLGIAETEIERISGIVRRMRDFYRPSSKKFEPTDVHEVLDGVLTLANKQLQHADVSVERDWFPDLPLVEANADHLKQVFLNMIINAIDAMPEGGTLRVMTRPDQMRVEEGHPPVAAARIDFQDTGVGMSPDIQERLFEPFFTTKDHGSGLGLSISFNIVRSHKGEILVESEKGKGTIFSILLPVEQVVEVKRND